MAPDFKFANDTFILCSVDQTNTIADLLRVFNFEIGQLCSTSMYSKHKKTPTNMSNHITITVRERADRFTFKYSPTFWSASNFDLNSKQANLNNSKHTTVK